jgi:hypothetical protein
MNHSPADEIEPLTESIAPALFRDGQVMGADGQETVN